MIPNLRSLETIFDRLINQWLLWILDPYRSEGWFVVKNSQGRLFILPPQSQVHYKKVSFPCFSLFILPPSLQGECYFLVSVVLFEVLYMTSHLCNILGFVWSLKVSHKQRLFNALGQLSGLALFSSLDSYSLNIFSL